ncbi:MAG: hypothetical protein AB7Q29_09830 [Vicinamibacterales bacterium]
MKAREDHSLTAAERDGIVLAVQSAFAKLRNMYREIAPVIARYGFTPPSAGVIARDLSEKIETSIVQHCPSFTKGQGHCDLSRGGEAWEVKICKDSGLTINQSKRVMGEHYIVVNYRADQTVLRVWVLYGARDEFFSPRRSNANARSLLLSAAEPNIERLYTATRKTDVAAAVAPGARMAKAHLPIRRRHRARS